MISSIFFEQFSTKKSNCSNYKNVQKQKNIRKRKNYYCMISCSKSQLRWFSRE